MNHHTLRSAQGIIIGALIGALLWAALLAIIARGI